eukprot:Selendium_serpulae@DN5938_c0_g1_i1.p1
MGSRSAQVNKPDTFEVLELPDGVSKVEYKPDAALESCGTYTLFLEDHTVANLIRMQLLRDGNVWFAGYKVPHPLENKVEIRIQTSKRSYAPQKAFHNALQTLQEEASAMLTKFQESLQSLQHQHETETDLFGFYNAGQDFDAAFGAGNFID